MRRAARWSAASLATAVAAVALVSAGCGGTSAAQQARNYNCFLRLQAIAKANAIVAMYQRGELGTAKHLAKEVGRPVPFLDAHGKIVNYATLRPDPKTHRDPRLAFDSWLLDLASVNAQARVAEEKAASGAREHAKKVCR